MMDHLRLLRGPAMALIFCMVLVGCQDTTRQDEARQDVALPPPELFTWTTGQPISFSPPPDTWNGSRYQNGGAEGVSYVLAGSGGEQILVAERFFLGRRDHCVKLKELLEKMQDYDLSSFRRAIAKARLYAPEPYNAHEKRTVNAVNETLDRASEAFSRADTTTAHLELEWALEQAATIRYTVEETVAEVLFTRERNSVYPALQVDEPVPGDVAGERALVVNFTFQGHGTPMVGRRVYLVKNNRMFEFGFQGLQENLALFEKVLDSVTFPPGACEH